MFLMHIRTFLLFVITHSNLKLKVLVTNNIVLSLQVILSYNLTLNSHYLHKLQFHVSLDLFCFISDELICYHSGAHRFTMQLLRNELKTIYS